MAIKDNCQVSGVHILRTGASTTGKTGKKRAQDKGQMHNLSSILHCPKRGYCVGVFGKRALVYYKERDHFQLIPFPAQENRIVYIHVLSVLKGTGCHH